MIKRCIDCGCEFEASNNKVRLCTTCKNRKKKERVERQYEVVRNVRFVEEKEYSPTEGIEAIGRVVAALEKYNQEHGTYLSYGKYVMLKERGELEND
jgi:predicted  nucleic acid-binding Zn-ribbon protein